ncbi:MAG TPA: ATP-binding cassette domain-containing protein [Chitinophagaceae bacterium]|nr:ATP-binding cassette domain-containing protein [Chitinophagaceae bacterium]
MKVSLTDAGKRFNRDWVFRHLTYTFDQNNSYAIVGPNGSGKSTLLQVLSGAMQASEGNCQWTIGKGQSADEDVYSYVALCAPYLELVEEMTLKEFLEFHSRFKPFLGSVDIVSIVSIIGLQGAMNKQIRFYSSGMKQRVKLAQAFFSDTPFLLLDEPCTNLDTAGIELYNELVNGYCKNRLVIVSSNDEVEYKFCKERINVVDYKQ